MTGPNRAKRPGLEVRALGQGIELRADGDKTRIVGRAVVFDTWTTLYRSRYFEVREKVNPGAFTNTLREGADVRGLWNHLSWMVLGRNRSGTLRVWEEGTKGLDYEIDPPATTLVREMAIEPIRRGDVTGSSFAFTVRPDGSRLTIRTEGDDYEIWERELLDLDLFDVSPVTYPAYEDTSTGLRAFEDLSTVLREVDEARAERARLRFQQDAQRRTLELLGLDLDLSSTRKER